MRQEVQESIAEAT
ncbi:hypothetical protein GMOD_00003508 [Pyrenophora seminiperda CCB06]|uniref:Uncharacterized protein n=1 Tax=Pyrenophora seminiperda CCB06 TaxID=1302712 RepID=A0A3M7MJC3_9PLEO|nr:hypothetical protein GMOD_00003508 [Pyrenophora seminiperda CCB06]